MTARRAPVMTHAMAGAMGGARTAELYSRSHFRRIGRKGGLAGGRPRLRTLEEIEASTRAAKKRPAITKRKGGSAPSNQMRSAGWLAGEPEGAVAAVPLQDHEELSSG